MAKNGMQISEEDALAYSHMQELASIQAEIRALRSSIPVFLTPLLNRPAEDHKSPGAAEKAEDFRLKATKIQGDVTSLVQNLERMCGTLEAAEKVRNEDYDETGQLSSLKTPTSTTGLKEAQLERVGVVKEYGNEPDGGPSDTAPDARKKKGRTPSIHIDQKELVGPQADGPLVGTGSSTPRSPRGKFNHQPAASIASISELGAPQAAQQTVPEPGDGMHGFDSNDIIFDDFELNNYSDLDWTNPDMGMDLGISPAT